MSTGRGETYLSLTRRGRVYDSYKWFCKNKKLVVSREVRPCLRATTDMDLIKTFKIAPCKGWFISFRQARPLHAKLLLAL